MTYEGKKILLLDGYTSQCLEYLKRFKFEKCETTVLCGSKLDVCYASRYPDHKVLGACSLDKLDETEAWIDRLVESGKFDLVIAFTEYSATLLSHNKERLSKFAKIVVNDENVFDFAQDKNNVMKVCMENGLPCPKTVFDAKSVQDIVDSKIQFPIILKPAHGFGSRGFHKVTDIDALKKLVAERDINLSKMVVQECLPIESLVMSDNIFVDKNGKVQSSFLYGCYRVYPIDGGSGVLNVTFNRPEIHEACAKLMRLLNLKGPVGVDLMIDPRDDTAKIIEVNLRPLACAKVGFLAGVDPAKQVLEDAFGETVTPMMEYKNDIRVRRLQIDCLWFIKSPNRFSTKPSWFSWKNTSEQLFSWDDPLPWFAFTLHGLVNYKKEMKARS